MSFHCRLGFCIFVCEHTKKLARTLLKMSLSRSLLLSVNILCEIVKKAQINQLLGATEIYFAFLEIFSALIK